MSILCTRFTPYNKGTCKGFATILVEKWGVELSGITLLEKDGKRWIGFPSKEYESDGKKKYAPYVRFTNDEHYKKFCDLVKTAIEKKAQEIKPDTYPSYPENGFDDQEEIPF